MIYEWELLFWFIWIPIIKKNSNILSTENNVNKYTLDFKRGQLY